MGLQAKEAAPPDPDPDNVNEPKTLNLVKTSVRNIIHVDKYIPI